MVRTYDPNEVSVILGAKIISGFSDGTVIQAERNEQGYTLKVGVTGEGARAKSNNRSGKITLTLLQTSPSNDDISAFAIADEASNSGVVPLEIRDNNGTTLLFCATAWVQKFATVEYGKEILNRVWVIETDEMNMFVGGNAQS